MSCSEKQIARYALIKVKKDWKEYDKQKHSWVKRRCEDLWVKSHNKTKGIPLFGLNDYLIFIKNNYDYEEGPNFCWEQLRPENYFKHLQQYHLNQWYEQYDSHFKPSSKRPPEVPAPPEEEVGKFW